MVTDVPVRSVEINGDYDVFDSDIRIACKFDFAHAFFSLSLNLSIGVDNATVLLCALYGYILFAT